MFPTTTKISGYMGHNPKGHLQVAHGRKKRRHDRLPYPRVDKLGFEWVLHPHPNLGAIVKARAIAIPL
jgi:hypothetical protein